MTGFATEEAAAGAYRLVWEVRTVNHRFLDLTLRLPEDLRALEPRCRELVGAALGRGKVDCSLKLMADPSATSGASLSGALLEELDDLQTAVHRKFSHARELSVAEILHWPGTLEQRAADPAELADPASECLSRALTSLCEARRREGERLVAAVAERCGAIETLVADLGPRLPDAQDRYRAKLLERLERLDIAAEPARLEQELVLIAQRLDVTEELDRLASHVSEVRDVLVRDEPIGRRLDFLMQELNREANTLASKSPDEELTKAGVELKVLIEQMREQVQNLE